MPRSNEIPVGIRLRIVEMHQAGRGYKYISKSLDVHLSTVRQIIYKWKRFETVATLPRSGRPTKNNSTARRRKPSKDGELADPADHSQVQNITKKDNSSDAVNPDSFLFEAETANKDPSVHCLPEVVIKGEYTDSEMDHYSIVYEVGENADSSLSDVKEDDSTAHYFYPKKADETEDPGSERVHCLPEVVIKGEYTDSEMDHYSIVYEVGENADSSLSDVKEEDSTAHYFYPKKANETEDPGSERLGICAPSSDDERSEDDPMAGLFDPDLKQEQIHSGSALTCGALLLLLLTFISKHRLSNAAVKDLLDILNLLIPGCVPRSPLFLNNYSDHYSSKAEIHLYCPKCGSYVGVEPGSRCGACQQKLSKKCLLEKDRYFLVMPLEVQLRRVLPRVHSQLGRHAVRDGCVSDIVTGQEYDSDRRADRITLTFRCHGIPLDSKRSIWPILCTINELPYAERGRNVLLHTLWLGPGRPHVQSYFTPFINELQRLSNEGFRWTDHTGAERRTTVAANVCVCDSALRSMLQTFQSFDGEFGCSFCYHRGELVPRGRGFTRVYPVQTDGCGRQQAMGVRGPSPLVLLPSFDIIKGFLPDYMQCFCLGVVPEFVDLWFDSGHAHKPFHLTPQHLHHLDEALCAVQTPHEIRLKPRRLSDRKRWTASEWRAFALLYSPVLLEDVLPILYYVHWMLLISALHTLLSPFATWDELRRAEASLLRFVAQVPSLYGLENCSFSCHLLTHLGESARDWGLLWANSSFTFEGVTHRLLQMLSGLKSASSQVFSHVFLYEDAVRRGSLALQDADAQTKDLFCSMTGCAAVTKLSGVKTLGSGSQRFLTATEVAALQKPHQSSVTEYKRVAHNNTLISTLERSDSVIQTSGGFAVVQSIVALNDGCSGEETSKIILFCKKLLPWGQQLHANVADFQVRVRHSEEVCAVTCGDVVVKCFVIEREHRLYVMRMPVFEMH